MKFGVLNFNASSDQVPFSGKIACRQLNAKLQLRLEPSRSQNAPDFSVWANEGNGAFQIGSAWRKSSQNCPEFLSMTFDSPDFDAPLNLTAFPADASGSVFDIVWERPKQSRQKKAVDTGGEGENAGAF